MKPDAWMPVYIGDYLRDTLHLGATEHGAYFLLMMAYWCNKGPLTDDDRMLRSITKCPDHEWARTKGTIARFFTIQDGKWIHKRIDEELKRTDEAYRKKVAQTEAARLHKGLPPVTTPVTAPVTDNVSPPVTPDTGTGTGTTLSGGDTKLPLSATPTLPAEVIEWNQHQCLPGVVNMSKDRVKKLSARRRDEYFKANFAEAIKRIAASDFCCGKNDRSWVATFDFLLQPGTVTKVLEGKYDNRKPQQNTKHTDRNAGTHNANRPADYYDKAVK